MSDETDGPALRLIRGQATPEEIAALSAVLSAVQEAGTADASEPGSGGGSAWLERAALLRRPLSPGPGAWRASGWTR